MIHIFFEHTNMSQTKRMPRTNKCYGNLKYMTIIENQESQFAIFHFGTNILSAIITNHR